MRRTFVARVEDRAGSFLKAARIIGSNGGNIVRTSYNRSVDSRTMFLEVSADDPSVFDRISEGLGDIGYLEDGDSNAILISITVPDVPNAIVPVLEILSGFDVNISYLNAQDNGTPVQHFKMALHIDDPSMTKGVLDRISELYEVNILDYEMTDKVLDNTVFYMKFSSSMRDLLSLDESMSREMTICSNAIMQMLDDRGEIPFITFDYVRRFAEFVISHGGEAYSPRISSDTVGDLRMHIIEPPCGSTVYALEDGHSVLLVDGGFPCYTGLTTDILRREIPGFDSMEKVSFLTHSDLDHVGLVRISDRIMVSGSTYDDFVSEVSGRPRYRESNPVHAPYYRISAIIVGYIPLGPDRMEVIGRRVDGDVYGRIGSFSMFGKEFVAYEGNGGHVEGDTILVCESLGLVFTGDDYIDIKGSTREQREFNSLAPYLMQSVNTDSSKARDCRLYIEHNFPGYLVCPGHGHPLRFRSLQVDEHRVLDVPYVI
ncbi:MAG: hypothetical protein SPJ57_03820 [Candidatus Methanomethylophilaceae archaeon]|nr:hypothetical protein [Candidatus Methanomethylophilaceae archaeon]